MLGLPKVLGLKKFESGNILNSEKILGWKMMVPKNFWVQQTFRFKKLLGLKKILFKNISGTNNFDPRKNVGFKKFMGLNKILDLKEFKIRKKFG